MEEGVGCGGHWPICSLYSAESITTSMVRGSEGREELCYLYFLNNVSRHSSVQSHLDRFRIVEYPICVCLKDYETVDHLIWHCDQGLDQRDTDLLMYRPK
jgi:hypothetical protein